MNSSNPGHGQNLGQDDRAKTGFRARARFVIRFEARARAMVRFRARPCWSIWVLHGAVIC